MKKSSGAPQFVKYIGPVFTAVVLLTVTVGYIHYLESRIRKGDAEAIVRIQAVGKVSMAMALIAIIFAVLTFN